ncbi:MAG: Nramp family divalent metal transporter [Bacteroidales bacterium]|nr:Nramp family divalent metal transporter [Bacteroidales bacterium]
MRKRFLNILFWSVISAAFIGPGTVTTAAKAGTVFQYQLLWALLFSTIACIVLQEAAARLTLASGLNLGEAIRRRYKDTSLFVWVVVLVVGAIILGSAAYETGNILGALAGIRFIATGPSWLWVLLIAGFAAVMLSRRSVRGVANVLGTLVAVMGMAFFITAVAVKPQPVLLLKGMILPKIPSGSGAGLLVLGLIGTTVVPYNLFLGSGMAGEKQSLKEMRFGLSVAVILGGLISMAVLVVGTAVQGTFSYEGLVAVLRAGTGRWAVIIFGIGMLAAGFTSAVTAPLASAITAKSLLYEKDRLRRGEGKHGFVLTWLAVLLTGVAFGLADVKPVPVIILAQALNGLVLPLITLFLFKVINDSSLMGEHKNSRGANLLMFLVNWVTLTLGLWQLTQVTLSVTGIEIQQQKILMSVIIGVAFVLDAVVGRKYLKN